jgi:hypothetical protein
MRGVNGRIARDGRFWGGASLFINRDENVTEMSSIGRLERMEIRRVASGNLANFTESGNRTANDAACLRVTNSVLNLDETGKELGQERADSDR